MTHYQENRMPSSPATRLCMLEAPTLPLDVFGHRPYALRHAAQPECNGQCREKSRNVSTEQLLPSAHVTTAPGGAWVFHFVLHGPECEVMGWNAQFLRFLRAEPPREEPPISAETEALLAEMRARVRPSQGLIG